MKTFWTDKAIKYSGEQLSSKWAEKAFKVRGDSIVAFRGACEVKEDKMVDLDDLKNKEFIYSEDMLHFIVEIFELNLARMVAVQRLLIVQIKDILEDMVPEIKLVRRGDDLFEGKYKLTVSIATLSPVSSMIHTGINISSKNTPVLTKGLADHKIEPKAFAEKVLDKFKDEVESMQYATTKVRSVP